jgi:hypothetical protein
MGISITLPTPGDAGTSGTWGTTLNTAINAINNATIFKLKTSTDTRTSTTLTDDDDLQAMTLGVGTWLIEVGLIASGPTAGDLKVAWAFSGTTSDAYRAGTGPTIQTTNVTSAAAAIDVGVNRSAAAGNTNATITSGPGYGLDGTNWSWIVEKGVLVVTVSGTFKIQTAQVAASGTTTIQAGSYCLARQVA